MSIFLPRFSCFFLFLFCVCAAAQQIRPSLIRQPIDESNLVTLRGNTHPLAQPVFDLGAAPPDLPMDRMLLVLKRDPQQQFAVGRLLDDQQDRNSANYHKWMTPIAFGAQYGATDQDIQLITGWLQIHGFQVNRVSNGRSVIEFSGVESQVEQAFHTQIHRYSLPNGELHWANAMDPQIPAALAPAVAGVWSLHDFKKKSDLIRDTSPLAGSGIPAPQFTSSTGRHALMPGDFATIYNLNPLYAQGIYGQGTTIAIVGRTDFDQSDVYNFWSQAGFSAFINVVRNGPDPGVLDPGEEFEANLDVTWSGSVARGASLKFVTSASTNTTDGVDLSELYIVDNNAGDVMTESFGLCEAYFSSAEAQAISALAQQAAAEGITYMVSSGDNGAEGCVDPNSSSAGNAALGVNMLASAPFIVAVGGTMFNDNSNPATYWNSTNGPGITSVKSYIPENVWNESCSSCGLWAGSGGKSNIFSKPNWQFGVSGIPNDGARDLPDVSLSAAIHDPYLVCFHGQCFYAVGGTSASAPSFAGIMALIVQQWGRQGAANYILYRLASKETLSQCNASSTTGLPGSSCIFNDVTKGNNAVPGEPNYGTSSALYQAGTGYDLATGLGSVNANNLVTKWNTVTFNATNTTLGPSTISGTHGSSVSLNISVAPSSGTATPTGDVSLQTGLSPGANPGFLTLSSGSVTAHVNNLPGGSYTLTARYGGDSTYAPSTSNGIQVNITPENSTTTVSLFTAAPNGAPVPFSSGPYGSFLYPRADVAGQSGNGVPSGSVFFRDNGTGLDVPQPLNSQGNAALLNACSACLNAGHHSLTADYSGDGSFNASTSAPVPFTITQTTTALTLSANPNAGPQGSTVTLAANLTSPAFAGQGGSIGYPTGTVTFWSGNTQLGSSPIFGTGTNANGLTASASFSSSTLPIGSSTITAQYAGDTNYLGSTSPSVTVNLSADFTFNAGNASISVAQGGSVTNVLTITGQTGYSNTVAFSSASCSGLPALATCSFNPPSVTGTGNTTVTIRTTAPSYAAVRGLGLSTVGLLFAGVLLMGVPSRRRRSYAALPVLLCALVIGSTACGGGSSNNNAISNPGTPKGSYAVTVKATTTDQAVSHSISFTLVVQ